PVGGGGPAGDGVPCGDGAGGLDLRLHPGPWGAGIDAWLPDRGPGGGADPGDALSRGDSATQRAVRLKIREWLLAGMATVASRRNTWRSATAVTSPMSRTPHAGFCWRRLSSKAALLGAVCCPSIW